jgi:hypothetical protein
MGDGSRTTRGGEPDGIDFRRLPLGSAEARVTCKCLVGRPGLTPKTRAALLSSDSVRAGARMSLHRLKYGGLAEDANRILADLGSLEA